MGRQITSVLAAALCTSALSLAMLLGAALLCGAVPAAAETLTVTGTYPAGNGHINDLISIAVDRLPRPA